MPNPPSAAPIAPGRGTALHRQVFLVLRDQIGRGELRPGGALPNEEALCQRFGVSRITVRRALGDLAQQRLVERRQGLGTFVSDQLPQPRERPTLSLIDGLRRTVTDTQVTVFTVEHEAPPAEVAELLAIGRGVHAVHAVRLRSIGSTPVMLTDAWVPMDLGRPVTAAALRRQPLYEILQSQGVELGRIVQEITAVVADPVRAQALQTEVGSPLIKLVRLMHGRDDRPVEYLNVYLCPERSRVLMDIGSGDINTLSAGQVVHDIRAPQP